MVDHIRDLYILQDESRSEGHIAPFMLEYLSETVVVILLCYGESYDFNTSDLRLFDDGYWERVRRRHGIPTEGA